MHSQPENTRSRRSRRGQRGEVIIIAIGVMFLLAFIAGLFLTLISRNIGRVARGGDVLQAQYLAEAGLRYADQQLTHSADGADWRPDPPQGVATGDPDEGYLKAGYTRFNQGNGRFLLRVSYNPVKTFSNPNDATDPNNGKPVDAQGQVSTDPSKWVFPNLDKYIKIESIGRRGVVDANDPTTWRNQDPLRRMLVAYKPIAITDYVRYVTNKNRSDNTMVLGADPFTLPSGNPDANFRTYWNGPIRVNGDLMWTGYNTILLNSAEKQDASLKTHYPMSFAPDKPTDTSGKYSVNRDDNVAVAGNVFHDALPQGLDDKGQTRLNAYRYDVNGAATPVSADLEPSVTAAAANPNFTTVKGLYRDAGSQAGSTGGTRGVARLEPPLMDDTETSTGILRYRLMTRNAGVTPPGKSFNTGANGLGLGIYIDNAGEIQKDNQYRRLTDEWARTGTGRETESTPGSAWRQHVYTPPGAEIYLDPTPSADLNSGFPAGQSQGTIIITRHDGKTWKDENGNPDGFTRRYRYPLRQVYNNDGTLDAANTETYDDKPDDQYRDSAGAYKTFQNGVIYSEGNVRIQGKLPSDWKSPKGQVVGQHLTIVTNGTAYIEGNLLKGDAAGGDVNGLGQGVQLGTITVLAKDYVCVNTTAYFMRQPDAGAFNFALNEPYTELSSAGERYTTSGFSAVDPTRYNADAAGHKFSLLMLDTAESFPGAAADATVSTYPSGSSSNPTYQANSLYGTEPLTVSPGQSSQSPAENVWEHRAISLDGADQTNWATTQRPMADWFSFVYRPYHVTRSPYDSGAGTNYGGAEFGQDYAQPLWISRVALSPMDVRIEAVMYAQEGSFFVIPGEYLNDNSRDTRSNNVGNSLRYSDPVTAGWRVADLTNSSGATVKSPYPFYAEPPDVRVVINGAVAENTPADKDYQTAWARHWGYTPVNRPDGTDSAHNGEGLVYLYDQDLRLPLRFDRFNRPLPPAPSLPVSPDMIFAGEAA